MSDKLTKDDGWTEATDIQVDRVDLVPGAANGTSFLLVKSDGQGVLTSEEVAELVKEADEPVVKADDLDVNEPLADGEGSNASPDMPGSPGWEAIDAATARKWAAILARAKNAVELLADRERTEASVSDGDGYDNAYDLEDAACAIDCAISLLAPYALGEQMEVEFGSDGSPVEEVTKVAASINTDDLAVIEALAPMRKAGRVLSSANEAAIRSAVDSLQGVLSSLPAAPVAEEVIKSEEAPVEQSKVEVEVVAKAAQVVEVDAFGLMLKGAPTLTAFEILRALAAGGQTVQIEKAAGDAQLAVFDQNGKLIGTVDPTDLTPIAASAAQAEQAGAEVADGEAPKPAEAAPAAPAAEAPKAEAPAAPAAAHIPGTNTVQAPAPQAQHDEVTKAALAEVFGDVLGPLAEQLGKYAELAKAVEQVQERVEKIASRPDVRNSPVLHGANGIAGPAVRGEIPGAGEFAELEKAVDEATSDGERRAALATLAFARTKARFERN